MEKCPDCPIREVCPETQMEDARWWWNPGDVKVLGGQAGVVQGPGPRGILCNGCNVGSKNKKHKALGPLAVRATLSASRVKSATAGEAPNENPVARPPSPLRRCCQQLEPRVKGGMSLSPGLSSRAAAASPEGEGFFAPGRTLGLKISVFLSYWLPIGRPCLR